MEAWKDEKLSSNQTPVLLTGEEDLITAHAVALYNRDVLSMYQSGNLKLTSHRIIWWQDQTAISLALSDVTSLQNIKKQFNKSAKIQVDLAEPFNTFVRLSFRKDLQHEFFNAFLNALAKKLWLKDVSNPLNSTAPSAGFSTRGAGITGILAKREQEKKAADNDISEAFTDLTALITKANDMVKLAERLQNKMTKTETSDDDQAQFKSYLRELGIVAPVTKDKIGNSSKYIQQLAREISQFMVTPLKDQGGIMPLTSVYCLYNKARGQELISPDDLMEACDLLESMGLDVIMRTFDSGVKVLQLRSMSDEAVIETISKMFKYNLIKSISDCIYMTASEYSVSRSLPLNLAKDQLLTAERAGIVCRDESLEGLLFYTNCFVF